MPNPGFNFLLAVQTIQVLKTVQKCKKSIILKNDGHFRIPHPQISLKQFSVFKHLRKCSLFFYYVGGWKNDKGFSQKKFKKKLKKVSLVFFYILQLPHTLMSNSEKLTHSIVEVLKYRKKF